MEGQWHLRLDRPPIEVRALFKFRLGHLRLTSSHMSTGTRQSIGVLSCLLPSLPRVCPEKETVDAAYDESITSLIHTRGRRPCRYYKNCISRRRPNHPHFGYIFFHPPSRRVGYRRRYAEIASRTSHLKLTVMFVSRADDRPTVQIHICLVHYPGDSHTRVCRLGLDGHHHAEGDEGGGCHPDHEAEER